ncbi:hypothetical protein [Sulfolobus acidocaldarius]|uniref:Conserved protein n=4 Tax=Sulfolobus acidocaldarius TaxID=2285 RepID=Q4JCM7_SULAC|nr:hypothetical protein [Sulfolobus acidocaldarius]AAY79452.1 conserved protein [Sulfolobus acidocaldarius DSM 639]AGE70002.1 hypothetical protein SacN8_00105 [Sulfolobus acidocaldarius N8]AGE72277.1 hypothetical protein SacRon12I_00105 [Sulfolobus acidocaldarius Ron12/I]ALU29567.1 hypothetical protein ATY89_06145 [Sulfolobus acidocaldarius]ALU32297.1 hypothetical protein ATZ20_09170 [Sulfolobus acidocaldarius]
MEKFWEYYKVIEKGTLISFEEFKNNREINLSIREAIKFLYKLIESSASKITSSKGENLIWDLARKKVIRPSNIEEFIDVVNIATRIEEVDDSIIYPMLVRIMEDLEDLYFSIINFKNS